MQNTADIAVVGLAVMGQNLILNMNDHGYTVAAFNRTVSKVDEFLADAAKGRSTILPAHSLPEMIGLLKRPRKIMLMVKAGGAVDDFIEALLPLLDKGDIIIDGGNSYFPDTIRRTKMLKDKGILFVGTGVSGGEAGARSGPSIMPGGNPAAWTHVKPIFQAISAKTTDGTPCCDWVGGDGAGHYVKMVHNGIEYGDMQLICEAYQVMRDIAGLSCAEMSAALTEWNKGDLDSYLIEITADILKHTDTDGTPLVDRILDAAGQKGTGKWTSASALDLGVPVTLIGEAVFSRCLSALKEERVTASKLLKGPAQKSAGDTSAFVADVSKALLASKIVSYAQGFMLMAQAGRYYQWNLDYAAIALMWRGGCIIRSVFLDKIAAAFRSDSSLKNLLLDSWFRSTINDCQLSWRRVVSKAVERGVPVPAFSAALAFYDGYRCEKLPANLLQAQRDYFGAHTYERTDQPRGKFFHTNWTGSGGDVAAGTYNA